MATPPRSPRRPARRSTLSSHSPPPPSFRPPEKPPPPVPDLASSPRHARRPGHPSPVAPGQTLRPVSVVLFSSSGKLSEYCSPSTSLPNIFEKYQMNYGKKIWDAKNEIFSWWVVVGAMATPAVKADELQAHPVKDQLPNIYYCITSPPSWPEAILLGFQHYLIILGTTVIILTALVPQMGGGNYIPHAIHAKTPIFGPFIVIFTVAIVWLYAYFLTDGGAYKLAAPKTQAHCRIDKSGLIGSSPWICVPYPFQWGPPSFDVGEAFAMMAAYFVALVEYTGTFIAVLRYVIATLLPPSILSRSISWQGIGILLDGLFGTANGSTVSVENAGLLALTRVVAGELYKFQQDSLLSAHLSTLISGAAPVSKNQGWLISLHARYPCCCLPSKHSRGLHARSLPSHQSPRTPDADPSMAPCARRLRPKLIRQDLFLSAGYKKTTQGTGKRRLGEEQKLKSTEA